MGSTTSSDEPVGDAVMQSGSITAATMSRVSGAALAIRNAQARPAMTARWSGRGSGILSADVANILDSPSQSFRGARSANPERRTKSRPLIERLAQGDVALLLLGPVAAAGDGAVDHEIMAIDEAGLVAGQEHCG